MGREIKILLGLLATLFGVFLGVLSMKLLVPRPPAGTGPDVHADVASSEPQDLVEPPAFDTANAESPAPPSRFGADRTPATAPTEPATVVRDPYMTRASFESPPRGHESPSPPSTPTASGALPAADQSLLPGAAYIARPGDSWWSLAERVYGDGRFYRAVFAWNRALDPRVSLIPGTTIDLPTRDRLEAAWPSLVPPP